MPPCFYPTRLTPTSMELCCRSTAAGLRAIYATFESFTHFRAPQPVRAPTPIDPELGHCTLAPAGLECVLASGFRLLPASPRNRCKFGSNFGAYAALFLRHHRHPVLCPMRGPPFSRRGCNSRSRCSGHSPPSATAILIGIAGCQAIKFVIKGLNPLFQIQSL